MSLLLKREVILGKVEATYGVDATPAATDAILVEAPSWAHANARMLERPAVRASLGMLRHVYGGTLKSVTFAVEVKGSGAAGTVPEIGALLRACGFGETIVAATSVTYAPVSTALDSVTIYYYQDGVLQKLLGCRGTITGTFAAGQIGKLNFTFTGHLATETDTALVTPTYDSTVPAPVINSPFTLGGTAIVVNQVGFDMQNQIAPVPSVAATDGFGEIRISARDVIGTLDPEMTLIATKNFWSEFRAGTPQALSLGAVGASAGNKYDIDMPAVSYRELAPGDREGVRTFEIGFGAAESAGDDEVSIAFT